MIKILKFNVSICYLRLLKDTKSCLKPKHVKTKIEPSADTFSNKMVSTNNSGSNYCFYIFELSIILVSIVTNDMGLVHEPTLSLKEWPGAVHGKKIRMQNPNYIPRLPAPSSYSSNEPATMAPSLLDI